MSTSAPLVGLAAAVLGALTPPAAGATTSPPATPLVWSILSPSSTPPPLEFASAVYDSDNHTIVLFGGLNSQGSLSDSTWVWNGSTWTDYSPAQIEEPPARYLASMAFDPALHQLLLFGGRNAAGRQLNDTWAWNGASWYNVNRAEAIIPAPRDGASLAYDGQGHLLLFGGEGPTVAGGSTPSPGASPQSSPSQDQNLSLERPATTAAPATPLAVLGDTWAWGSSGWTPVATSGPPPRLNAAATYDPASGAVLVFGGTSTPAGSTSPPTPLGDTWTWRGTGWSQASPAASPPPRFGAVAADDPVAGGVVLFGGSSGAGPLQDSWLWNGSGWSQIPTTGAPGARLGAVGGFETASGQFVVFGGAGANGEPLGNTVVLTAGAPLPLGPATIGPTTTVAPQKNSPSTKPTVPTASSATAGTPNAPQRSRALAVGGNGSGVSGGKRLPVLHRRQLVTLHGSGFTPDALVTITFHSTPVVVGKTTADSRGDISATVAVPDRAPAGTHHFDASGLTPSGQSTKVLATVMVAVSAPSSRPSLATTGALVGVALLLPLGTWLLLGARSRVRHRVA